METKVSLAQEKHLVGHSDERAHFSQRKWAGQWCPASTLGAEYLAYRAEGVQSGHYSGKEVQSFRNFRKMDIVDN